MKKQGSSNDSSAYEEKPSISSVQQKKSETSPDMLLAEEKYFYGLFTQIASVLELCVKAIGKKKRVADKRHMSDRIKNAQSFQDRDKVLRDLAAYCYDEGKKFAAQSNPDMQIKWFKLLLRFLKCNPDDLAFDQELSKLQEELKAWERSKDQPLSR